MRRSVLAPPREAASWLLIVAVLIAAALRFSTLSTQSFEGDELYTAWLVRQPLGDMLATVPKTESTPYLYYLLAWGWTRALGGSGEAALRSLSAIAGVLTVPAAALLGRRLISRRAGLVGAALVAVSPLLVWFSQQARAYALFTLWVTLATAAFAAAERERRALRWWAVLSTLALVTHYFAAFVFVPQALWLARRARRDPRAREGLGWVGLPLAATIALVPLAWIQRHNPGGMEGTTLARRIAQVPKTFLVGFQAPAEAVLTVVAVGVAALAVAGLLRLPAERRSRAVWLALHAGVLLVPPVVLALVGIDLIGVRNMLPAIVPVLILLGAGGLATRYGRVALVALIGLSVAIVIACDTEPSLQRADWRGAMAELGPAAGPRAVVARPGVAAGPLSVYLANVTPFTSRGARVAEIDLVGLATKATYSAGRPRPPRPVSVKAPPGFRETGRRQTDTFTVIRLAAASPRQVGVLDLLAPQLGTGLPGLYVQRPPG